MIEPMKRYAIVLYDYQIGIIQGLLRQISSDVSHQTLRDQASEIDTSISEQKRELKIWEGVPRD